MSDKPIRFGVPSEFNTKAFYRDVAKVIDTGQYTNDGPMVRRFEERICEMVNAKHCIAVSNATVGLFMLAKQLEFQDVFTSAFTFPATYKAMEMAGAVPVFYDVNLETHQMDCRAAPYGKEDICLVDMWGNNKHWVKYPDKTIIDSAHAFGKGRQVRALAEVFSFHATKFISCGEGGAIVTNDEGLAEDIRCMRSFGFTDSKLLTNEYGFNAKMPELSACLGNAYLDNFDNILCANGVNHMWYEHELRDVEGANLYTLGSTHPNYQYVVVMFKNYQARETVWKHLLEKNIETKKYFDFPPNTSEKFFPNAAQLCNTVLCLPTGTTVGPNEIKRICYEIKIALEKKDD